MLAHFLIWERRQILVCIERFPFKTVKILYISFLLLVGSLMPFQWMFRGRVEIICLFGFETICKVLVLPVRLLRRCQSMMIHRAALICRVFLVFFYIVSIGNNIFLTAMIKNRVSTIFCICNSVWMLAYVVFFSICKYKCIYVYESKYVCTIIWISASLYNV